MKKNPQGRQSFFFPKSINSGSFLLLFALFSLLLAFFRPVNPVAAQNKTVEPEKDAVQWRITADEVRYDQNTDQYLAAGDVVISRENIQLSADRVRFHYKTMKVFAEGRVMLVSGKDILTGKRMEVDLNREVGTVYDGTIFIEENHFYIRGARLEKTGKNTYQAEQASLTTCDGDSPAWRITARDVKVAVEGYGTAWHAAIYANKTPVFYTPYLFFPVKQKRQSGFLSPQFGYSDRKGVEYSQPYFWAIDDHSDATFYGHFMTRRGIKLGAEYRYKSEGRSQGAAMADVLHDQKIDDGSGDSSKNWGFRGDPYLRPNRDRYWFRMKHDQELPKGFFGRLDLDFVSDQDYLREFKDGYSGFHATKDYFLDEFGREIDEYDDPIRLNRLNISRYWNFYSLNGDVRWYDDVNKRRHTDLDDTLQKLPFISFTGLRQPVPGSMLYFDLESEYTYFFREDGFTGHRTDIFPRLYLPVRLKNFIAFEPSVGIRETLWYVDDWDNSREEEDGSFNRNLINIRLDLSTELADTYSVDYETTDRIKHTIRPQVVYEYINPTNQDDIPNFDELDRIDKQSVITYSVTNTFSMRYRLPIRNIKRDEASGGNTSSSSVQLHGYRPFGRIKIQQSYDFNEMEEDRPFSPIIAKLDLALGNRVVVEADAAWSTYDSRFLTRNFALRASDKRGDRIFIEHRFTRDRNESFYGDLIVKLDERVSVFAEYERDMKNDETILYGAGLLYMASCWSVDVGLSKEEGDFKYAMSVNLYGLGGIGQEYVGRRIRNPFEFD